MSKITLCDVNDCKNKAQLCRVALSNIEIVPTGNSDYSAYEEQTVQLTDVDMCEKHYEEYSKRMTNVLIKSEKGLYFPNE